MEHPDASIPGPPLPPGGMVLALAELSERLDALPSLVAASTAVAEFAVRELGADAAGVCVQEPSGQTVRLAASSSVLVELDSIEAGLAEGPGTARLDEGEVMTVADTRTDQRWPAWSSAAAERGVLSACLVGMPPLQGRPARLQLFTFRADAFAAVDVSGVAAVAKLAGLALRHIDRLANLEEAIATRDLIGQAQGIIMERYQLTSEQAMHFLRRSSQHSQEKIRHIAQQLVSPSAQTPDPETRSPAPGAVDDEPSTGDR